MKLPKSETLILLAFLVCTALWAVSKCSAQRSESVRRVRELEDSDKEDRPVKRDTVVVPTSPSNTPAPETAQNPPPPVSAAPQTTAPNPKPGAIPRRPSLQDPATSTPPPSTGSTTLYVSIDGLKVRKEPGLKSETLATLQLYEPVTFLNKKTDWTQEISLGYEKVTDHWVKIRTQSGKEGWVFGAGLHYYKTKRQGVIESSPQKKNR